ncbi:TonB-dependent siderophore receptor [Nitrosomonas sp.]|uniref:TonB-dependent siderophore receptor n=1 Tax=Nitrosomonas sp. TaxID=42353 RepID=UPI0025FE4645|nr:TonB-dependent siderophore receptor [Nitrosomonas sp.]MBV6448070.1 putative TonB-dependent receptor BfrD [Nitrosomonas sp.]
MIIRRLAGYICFYTILFSLSLAAVFLPQPSAAQSVNTTTAARTYNIPAGYLHDALIQFSQQAGIKLAIDPALLQGKITYGLEGDFEIKAGLDQLLTGSGLQVTQREDGLAIVALPSASPEPAVTTLPTIQVTAGNTNRYVAASSSTATKTNTLLRDVPQSITVITNELIKDQSVRSIGDAVRYVPGVGISQGEGNRDALVFRGNRSTGDFFTDGIRDDVEYYRDLYNMERIEVLKGANGMIFGRGGSGGVVNRVSKQANWNPVQEFTFQGGSFNQKRMTADVGYVINDIAAVRLNALFEDSDSFRDDVNMMRLGISPTVTIKPTQRTKIVASMERFNDHRTADRGITSFGGRPVDVSRSQFFGDPRRSHANVDVLAFNSLIEHKFESGITLQNRTNYATYDKFYQNVFASSGVDTSNQVSLAAYNNATTRENVFNQTNLLYSLNTGPVAHTLMAGIEVGRQETHNRRETGLFNNKTTSWSVPLSDPTVHVPITFKTRDSLGSIDALNRSVVNVTSLYIQDQVEIIPQLQAIAGVRYDMFDVDFQQKNGSRDHLKTRDGLIAPRFGLIYKPITPISIYASYSQAYVPRAGDQLTALNVTVEALKPEKFTTLEVGVKWDVRPDLAFTAAVYQLDRTNVLSSITVSPNAPDQTVLTKGQRTEGVEVGLAGQLAANWSVMGGYAYQTGEITSDIFGVAKKGASVAELPRHTFSMWSRYDITPGIGAALGVIHRGSMYSSLTNQVILPDFTRVDAALFAQFSKRFRGQLNIENVFNTKYFASAQNDFNITPGSPIAVRASLIASF